MGRPFKRTPEYKAAYQKKWREAKRKKHGVKSYNRVSERRRVYGPLPPEPLNCECCGVPFDQTKKGSCVDHDHATGTVRGFLCHYCNTALGFAKDSRDRLQLLINYLDRAELLK